MVAMDRELVGTGMLALVFHLIPMLGSIGNVIGLAILFDVPGPSRVQAEHIYSKPDDLVVLVGS